MSIRTLALAASAILVATPVLAARHKSTDPVLNHTGPIAYSELQQLDSGAQGYNARSSKRHVRAHAADAATTPAPADAATASPSVPDPSAAVNAPVPPSADQSPVTATGQATPPAGEPPVRAPIPSTPSSPTPPATPQ